MSSQTAKRIITAPRGTKLNCKGWVQEAALRMLCNNLDPEVAERPEDLVVYGGIGKAARNWEAFDKIIECLKKLEEDETLIFFFSWFSLVVAISILFWFINYNEKESAVFITTYH